MTFMLGFHGTPVFHVSQLEMISDELLFTQGFVSVNKTICVSHAIHNID